NSIRVTPALLAIESHPETVRILVVDDEKSIREILIDFLTMEGFSVVAVMDGAAALDELRQQSYHVVLSDLKMPNRGGLGLLGAIQQGNLNVLTVMMTGFGTVETALAAMKKGAYDYILKPFKIEEVVRVIRRGLDHRRLQHENMELREALSLYRISEAIAQSLRIEQILDLIVEATLQETGAD